MKRKVLSVLLVVLMCMSMIACGGGGTSPDTDGGPSQDNSSGGDNSPEAGNEQEPAGSADGEVTTLELYTWWSTGEQEAGDAVIAEFIKDHPNIKVNANYIPYEDYASKINTMISAGQTPDVFFINEYLVNEWGNKGVGMDLMPMYEKEGVNPDDYYVQTAMFKTDGHLWGISPNMTTVVMYYNKELFDEAGVAYPSSDATNPWTWDEYVEAAKKLTKDINGNTPESADFDYNSVATFGTLMTSNTSWITLSGLLYSNGAGFANEEGTALSINTPEGIEVLKAVSELSEVHQVAPTVGMSKGLQSASAMLMNGQLAMFMDGAYIYPEFENEGYDVGVTAQPMFAQPSGMAWASAFMVSADTDYPEEAFELFKALVDYDYAVDAAKIHNTAVSNLPNTIASYESDEAIAKWAENYNEDYANVTAGLLTQTARKGECTVLKNFSKIVEQTIMPHLDKLWMGEMTADEVVEELDGKTEGMLEGTW